MFTVVFTPILIALLMLPMTAQLTVLKAEDKRRSEEVRLMLKKQLGKPARAPRPIADDAMLEAETEASQAFRF